MITERHANGLLKALHELSFEVQPIKLLSSHCWEMIRYDLESDMEYDDCMIHCRLKCSSIEVLDSKGLEMSRTILVMSPTLRTKSATLMTRCTRQKPSMDCKDTIINRL